MYNAKNSLSSILQILFDPSSFQSISHLSFVHFALKIRYSFIHTHASSFIHRCCKNSLSSANRSSKFHSIHPPFNPLSRTCLSSTFALKIRFPSNSLDLWISFLARLQQLSILRSKSYGFVPHSRRRSMTTCAFSIRRGWFSRGRREGEDGFHADEWPPVAAIKGTRVESYRCVLERRCALAITMKGPSCALLLSLSLPRSKSRVRHRGAVSLIPAEANPYVCR